MDILIDARIKTKCTHRICALRILIITMLACLEDHEITDQTDMPPNINVTETNDNILSITFIN